MLTDLVRAGKVRAIGSSTTPASTIVEAQWAAQRRGLQRFRSEQPTYSILNRSIENEVLPLAERYGMGVLVWSPLAQGLLTGRVRKGQQSDLRRTKYFRHMTDERRLDAVEQLLPIAEEAGLNLTHMARAFAIAHPGVTSAIAGLRTMEQLEDLIAGFDVALTDDVLDQIDAVVAPGTDVGPMDMAYKGPRDRELLAAPPSRRRPLRGVARMGRGPLAPGPHRWRGCFRLRRTYCPRLPRCHLANPFVRGGVVDHPLPGPPGWSRHVGKRDGVGFHRDYIPPPLACPQVSAPGSPASRVALAQTSFRIPHKPRTRSTRFPRLCWSQACGLRT